MYRKTQHGAGKISRENGIKFERKVISKLRELYPLINEQVPLEGGKYYVDAMLPPTEGRNTILEVKNYFAADVYLQLKEYERAVGGACILVAVCRNISGSVRLPADPLPLLDLGTLDILRPGFYLYLWSRYDDRGF